MGQVLTIVGGVLLVVSAVPHALLGWPPAAEQLMAAGVEAELIGGLAIGWYFGSAAMLGLGGAVLLSAPYVSTHHWVWRVPCCIGAVYLSFGVASTLPEIKMPRDGLGTRHPFAVQAQIQKTMLDGNGKILGSLLPAKASFYDVLTRLEAHTRPAPDARHHGGLAVDAHLLGPARWIARNLKRKCREAGAALHEASAVLIDT